MLLSLDTLWANTQLADEIETSNELSLLEFRMHQQIPLTRLLEIKMAFGRDGQLLLRAPLEGNTNHVGSAFAGSLSSLATIAGWALISLLLAERGFAFTVVIQNSSIEYLRRVASDFEASPGLHERDEFEKFVETLERKRRSRIRLNVGISDAEGLAVTFSGRYIASLSGVAGDALIL